MKNGVDHIKLFESSYLPDTENEINKWLKEMESNYTSDEFELVSIDMERDEMVTIMIHYKLKF